MSAKKKQQVSKSKQRGAKARAAASVGTSSSSIKRKKHSPFVIAVISFLAVVMALSILLPSLSSIFAQDAASNADAASTEAATSDATSAATTSSTGVSTIDAQYQPLVDSLLAKLKEDPKNLAHTLNVANDYMEWAQAVSSYASTDDEKSHVSDLWQKAIDYYQAYLKLNDSQDVHVRIALCTYYKGSTDEALKMLEEYCADGGKTYGPAWAYLGFMQESAGDTENAKKSYTKATEVDPDDTYGSKTYATERLAQLNSTTSAATTTTSSLQSALSNGTN